LGHKGTSRQQFNKADAIIVAKSQDGLVDAEPRLHFVATVKPSLGFKDNTRLQSHAFTQAEGRFVWRPTPVSAGFALDVTLVAVGVVAWNCATLDVSTEN
jgi:hypothetical protein